MPRFQQNINDPYLQSFLLYRYLKFVPSSCRCLLQVALAEADLMFYFVCLALFFILQPPFICSLFSMAQAK